MLIFLFILFPLALIIYCIWTKEKRDIIPIFSGMMAAVLFCALKVFLTYAHRVVPYDFSENLVYFLLKISMLPILILYFAFFLMVKDSVEYKIKAFFPLISSFYAVYLPYFIVSASSSVYSGYDLLLRPVIYLASICSCAISLKYLYKTFFEKKYIISIINLLLLLLAMLLPAVSDALYAIHYSFAVIIVIDLLFTAMPSAYFIFALIFSFPKKQLIR